MGFCLHYDCELRGSFGYCKLPVCTNPKYYKTTVTSTSAIVEKFTVKPLTNADRIRAMTDEELAEWLCEHVDCGEGCPIFHGYMCTRDCVDCEVGLLYWLKQEVEE